jgi:hypothetical protein
LSIRHGKIDWVPAEACGPADRAIQIDHGSIHYYWPGVGKFWARGGCEILVETVPGVEEHVVRLFLLGAVMAAVLHQRGLLLLHASALKVDGKAVIFMGEKGRGKSTLAASIQQDRNHEMLADDIVAVDFSGSSEGVVLPGFPQFKLWPDAIALLALIRW